MYTKAIIDWQRKVIDTEALDISSEEDLNEYIRILKVKGSQVFIKPQIIEESSQSDAAENKSNNYRYMSDEDTCHY